MPFLRLQSIRAMLMTMVGFATLLAVVIGALAHVSLQQVAGGGTDVVDRAKPAIALGTTRTAWAEFTSITAGKITIASTDGKVEADRAAETAYQQLQAGLDEYLAASPAAEQRDLVENKVKPAAKEAMAAWTDKVKPLTDVVNPDSSAMGEYSRTKANTFDTPAYVVSTSLKAVAELDAQAIDARIASAADGASRAVIQMWALAGVGALLILGLGSLIMRRVTRPLSQTVDVLERVAGGDLTPRLEVATPTEIAKMADALNTTLSTVHDVIEAIEGDAARLYDVAERVSQDSGEASTALGALGRGVLHARSSGESLTREVARLADLAPNGELAAALERIAGSVQGLVAGVSGAELSEAVAAVGAETTSSDASEDLASMAGNLNAMISLFVLRSSSDELAAG